MNPVGVANMRRIIERNGWKEITTMVTEKYQFPKITPEMHKEMQEWYKKHNHGKCAKRYHGAIGGDVHFEIIPTSIGDFLTVKCSCGAELNYEEL